MPVITIDNEFKIGLSHNIQSRYEQITQIINHTLIYHFKHVGSIYNFYCKNNDLNIVSNPVLDELATQLHAKYGPYFSKDNILRMAAFDEIVSAWPQLLTIAFYVSWEHIVLLLPFKDVAAWLYYIRLAHKNGLTVSELQKTISSNAFEQDETFLGKTKLKRAFQKSLTHDSVDQSFFPLWLMKYQRDWKPLFNVFKEPLLSSFGPLIQMDEYPLIDFDNYEHENLLIRISHNTDVLRTRLNRDLNEQLNLFFWETGRSLAPERYNPRSSTESMRIPGGETSYVQKVQVVETAGRSYDFSTTVTQQEFDKDEQQLLEKYKNLFDNLFTQHELQQMYLFATKVYDVKLIVGFCRLVTWEQIKELLALDNQADILSLALKIADENLSIDQIKTVIAANRANEVPKTKKKVKFTNNEAFNKKVAVNILYNNFFISYMNAF